MDIRHRILDAAARVYAQHGFRGATTRRIASEAGVNEVTLFRTFGSKGALFEELARGFAASDTTNGLPDVPIDPERELAEWAGNTLRYMRESRSLLRKSIGEVEERPSAAHSACDGPARAAEALNQYVHRLRERGLADPGADVETAVSMLLSAFFGDAMCREILPHAFPEPCDTAPRKYVRTFLRAVGAHVQNERAAVSRRALH